MSRPTLTVPQARQIYERNSRLAHKVRQWLKWNSDEGVPDARPFSLYRVEVGCPHCVHTQEGGYQCQSCEWPARIDADRPGGWFRCCDEDFGGVTYHDVCGSGPRGTLTVTLSYSHDAAELFVCTEFADVLSDAQERALRRVLTFVQAHCAWALETLGTVGGEEPTDWLTVWGWRAEDALRRDEDWAAEAARELDDMAHKWRKTHGGRSAEVRPVGPA